MGRCGVKKKIMRGYNIQVTRFGTRLRVKVPKPFLYELFSCSGTRGEGRPLLVLQFMYSIFIPAAKT